MKEFIRKRWKRRWRWGGLPNEFDRAFYKPVNEAFNESSPPKSFFYSFYDCISLPGTNWLRKITVRSRKISRFENSMIFKLFQSSCRQQMFNIWWGQFKFNTEARKLFAWKIWKFFTEKLFNKKNKKLFFFKEQEIKSMIWIWKMRRPWIRGQRVTQYYIETYSRPRSTSCYLSLNAALFKVEINFGMMERVIQ